MNLLPFSLSPLMTELQVAHLEDEEVLDPSDTATQNSEQTHAENTEAWYTTT